MIYSINYVITMQAIQFDIDRIITDYQSGKSAKQIADELGVHKATIARKLAAAGITMRSFSEAQRQYPLREDYFATIDTEDKAYILGLIYSDGSMVPTRNSMEICLQEDDRSLLEEISNRIYLSPKPLGHREGRQMLVGGKAYMCKPQYRFSIVSKRTFGDLTSLGLPPDKSLVLTFPSADKVPENLVQHFIRGYYDGDGCLTVNKKTKDCMVRILGTESFCEGVQRSTVELGVKSYIQKRPGANIFQISVTGNRQVGKFLAWIYKDSNLHMQRKHDKFETLTDDGILFKI